MPEFTKPDWLPMILDGIRVLVASADQRCEEDGGHDNEDNPIRGLSV